MCDKRVYTQEEDRKEEGIVALIIRDEDATSESDVSEMKMQMQGLVPTVPQDLP